MVILSDLARQKKMINKQKIKRYLTVFIMAIYMMTPLSAFAHNAYFLQMLIDENSMTYQGNVLEDKARSFNREAMHIENQLGNFKHLLNNNYPHSTSDPSSSAYTESAKEGDADSFMVFTFPAKEVGGAVEAKKKNDAGGKDADRAYLINSTLTPSLNEALRVLNDGKKFNNIDELVEMGAKITAAGAGSSTTVNGWRIEYGKPASSHNYPVDSKTGVQTDTDPKTLISTNDYVRISKGDIEYEFVYRMRKGYTDKSDPLYQDKYNELSGDTEYISWHQLVFQAHHSYFNKGWVSDDAGEMVHAGPLEVAVISFLENQLNTLKNYLGLYTNNELMLNDGIRGSAAWWQGIMPQTWADTVTMYHWLFQGIAWSLIALAITKTLIQKNLSTINPAMRVSMIESIQDLLLTGFILANIFPIINMFAFLNVKLVNVFGAVAPDLDSTALLNGYSNMAGGIFMQFFYFVVGLYLNGIYIVRAISTAILVASAPLFIVSMAFGGKWKTLATVWMKELMANIFLQSFHAFTLSFFILAQGGMRGIEGAVIAMSLIPLTEMFRTIVLGDAGSSRIASMVGMNSLSTAAGLLKGGVDLSAQARTNNEFDAGYSDMDSSAKGDAFKMAKAGGGGMSLNANAYRNTPEAVVATHEAHANMAIPTNNFSSDGTLNSTIHKDATTSAPGREQSLAAAQNAIKYKEGAEKAKGIAKAGLGVAAGAASVGVGAGMVTAFGGSNPYMAGMGINMARSGVNGIASGASGLSTAAQNAYAGISKQQDHEKVDAELSGPYTSFISDELFASSLPNGEVEIHRDGDIMAKHGILSATTDKNGRGDSTYTYDMKTLEKNHFGDFDTIKKYEQVFNSGAQGREMLQKQGITNVGRSADGSRYMVSYDETGKEKLGINKVQTLKDGRIVETKGQFQPVNTRITVPLNTSSPGSSSSGNTNPSPSTPTWTPDGTEKVY